MVRLALLPESSLLPPLGARKPRSVVGGAGDLVWMAKEKEGHRVLGLLDKGELG